MKAITKLGQEKKLNKISKKFSLSPISINTNKFLSKKRKRGKNFQKNEQEENNVTISETNETTLNTKDKKGGANKFNNQSTTTINKKREEFINMNDSIVTKDKRNKKLFSSKSKSRENGDNTVFSEEVEDKDEIIQKNFKKKNNKKRRKNFRTKGKRKQGRNNSIKAYIRRQLLKKDILYKNKFEEIKQQFLSEKEEIVFSFNQKINTQNKKIALLTEIQNQSEIHSKKMNKYILDLGTRFNHLFNSYKVLYIRKICDFIIEGLIDNYGDSMALTERYFSNNKGIKFQLMVFLSNTKGISINSLNLIIDFLMETKQNCSEIIHWNKTDNISFPKMKEVFYILLNKKRKKENDNEFNLNIKEMTGIILSDSTQENINESNDESISEENETNKSDDEKKEVEEKRDEDVSLNESEEKRIKELMSSNNNYNIKINDLKKMLNEKIKNNEKGDKDIAINTNQIIDTSYFYNLWKKSFRKEKYKTSIDYMTHINASYIRSPKRMNDIIVKLLPNYEINFFDEDPSKLSKKIKWRI